MLKLKPTYETEINRFYEDHRKLLESIKIFRESLGRVMESTTDAHEILNSLMYHYEKEDSLFQILLKKNPGAT